VGRVGELSSFGIMSRRVRTILAWAFVGIAFGAVMYGLLAPSGPRFRNTPFMQEYVRIHKICTNLRFHAEEHPTSAVHDFSGKGIDDLAAAGILSQDDAAYIREHRIEFFGFDPTRVTNDVPVLQSMFTNGATRRRIVGYSDGSTVAYNLETRQ
jgi:hypothetical protein